jgi:hypothetical protein
MSQHRRTERRYDIYMDFWHRSPSLQRFLGTHRARQTSMIDLDSVEYCWLCYTPLVMLEMKRAEEGARIGAVTAELAKMAGIEAYLVVYQQHGDDILWFEVEPWHPRSDVVSRKDPVEYARWLWHFRERHLPSCTRPEAKHWQIKYEIDV